MSFIFCEITTLSDWSWNLADEEVVLCRQLEKFSQSRLSGAVNRRYYSAKWSDSHDYICGNIANESIEMKPNGISCSVVVDCFSLSPVS